MGPNSGFSHKGKFGHKQAQREEDVKTQKRTRRMPCEDETERCTDKPGNAKECGPTPEASKDSQSSQRGRGRPTP